MADKSGIPANLGPAALVKLGTFQQPVVDFVSRLNRINWLAAAGDRETWDSEVERVWNREDALSRAHASNQLSDSVFDALGRIGNAAGRQIVMEAAEEYWIAASTNFYPEFISAYAGADVEGALRELILDDIVSIRFFRESIDWYEKGHWRCSVTSEGTRIVW